MKEFLLQIIVENIESEVAIAATMISKRFVKLGIMVYF